MVLSLSSKRYNDDMLNLTYEYTLIPPDAQRETFNYWLDICCKVYEYILPSRKGFHFKTAHPFSECGYEINRDVATTQVVWQRGYTTVGHIVNSREGKLHG